MNDAVELNLSNNAVGLNLLITAEFAEGMLAYWLTEFAEQPC